MVAVVNNDNSILAFEIATQVDVEEALASAQNSSAPHTQMATSQFNLFAVLMTAISGLEAMTIANSNHQMKVNMNVGQGMENELQDAYVKLTQAIWTAEHPPSKPWYETLADVVCDVVAAVATAL